MPSIRTPLYRPTVGVQISARALEIFATLERLRQSRRRRNCNVSALSGLCDPKNPCATCKAWSDAHAELHTELKLKPWRWPALPRNPHPPNSDAAKIWRPDGEQRALWNLLREAARSGATSHEHDAAVGAADGSDPLVRQ